jgi:hypothetical protein
MFKATPKQIEEWKKDNDVVFKISAPELKLVAYCRNPTRQEMSFIHEIKDPIKFNETLLKTCWLDGDMEIQTRDSVFMGLAPQIGELMHSAEVKLEKL